jgi:hypothetical protein
MELQSRQIAVSGKHADYRTGLLLNFRLLPDRGI